MLERSIFKHIKLNLKKYPIVAITGPRQSGKTTFLKQAFSDYRYVNLEIPHEREFAQKDTQGFLEKYNHKVIFDEAQYVPKLFSYLQGIVDENNIMGQFILSGSQNFNLMQNITQSLAGRVSIFKLFPFDVQEMKAGNILPKKMSDLLYKGAYPAIYDRNISPDSYYADYLTTYVNRDVSQLLNVQNQADFKRFIKLCATRAGQLVNFNDLARDAGISHSTARNWISVLETSYILFLLPPHFKNFSKRLIKSPKLYFYDTGLLAHLLNIRKGNISPTHNYYGQLFENLIISEKIKQNEHHSQLIDYFFWRDSHGHEIDLIWEKKEKLQLAEIKASKTINQRFFDELDFFQKLAGKEVGKSYVYFGGDENQKRTKYEIVSWAEVE